ncbi:MAG: LysM peptidoglycan-binding domain-containing protein [Alphaproteobacteria bacterium]
MRCAANSRLQAGAISPSSGNLSLLRVWLAIVLLCGLPACDRVGSSRYEQLILDADNKAARGDYERAVNLYEAALDDSPRGAEVHYKLALLYDDKLNDPVGALHHFKRYLSLNPNGSHAKDVKDSMKRDEIAALTALSGDSVITRAEAVRLRNENLMMHKELEERTASRTALEKSAAGDTKSKKAAKKLGQTYVVQSGDTLFSISRKFYKSSKRWKDILEANKKSIRNPKDLTVGQTLVIP